MAATPPLVLTFAATDPSGGAGLQADILTIASIGCHPLAVTAAITVQDSARVNGILACEAEWIDDQARTILEDMQVAAFKLGLLGSVENIAVIAEIVADYPDIPLVIDPILASGHGDELTNEDMQDAMVELLFPQATLITPNSLEARRLAFAEDSDEADDATLDACAFSLRDMGCEYVLITGTHERTADVVNTLYGPDNQARSWSWERLSGSYHGSGCTLSAAIAACMAHGLTVEEAVAEAQEYTWQTLKAGFRPGMGQYIPDRLFWVRKEDADNTPD